MSLTDAMTLPTAPALPQATAQQRKAVGATAEKFEGQMLAQMLQPMFEGLSTDGPFSGGQSEGTWRSFLTDAIGKQVARAGGVGLAGPVAREMLKMQGLS